MEKILLYRLGIEPRFLRRPAHSLVSIPTELPGSCVTKRHCKAGRLTSCSGRFVFTVLYELCMYLCVGAAHAQLGTSYR